VNRFPQRVADRGLALGDGDHVLFDHLVPAVGGPGGIAAGLAGHDLDRPSPDPAAMGVPVLGGRRRGAQLVGGVVGHGRAVGDHPDLDRLTRCRVVGPQQLRDRLVVRCIARGARGVVVAAAAGGDDEQQCACGGDRQGAVALPRPGARLCAWIVHGSPLCHGEHPYEGGCSLSGDVGRFRRPAKCVFRWCGWSRYATVGSAAVVSGQDEW
jgi:hypothetical protein